MPDRRGSRADATDRPEQVPHLGPALLTVRDVLHLAVVEQAIPEVIAGAAALDRPVRWVHVSDNLDAPGLLDGGELLLSTGAGWDGGDDELRTFVRGLARVGVAGLVLELGKRFTAPPAAVVAACEEAELPFVVLHRVARFVAVTEAVHSSIISEQTEALRARDRLHALFIGLSLRGSTADYIVSQLAKVLRAPVILEDLTHRVVAAETLDAGDEVLAAWESASRAAQRTDADAPGAGAGWDVVAVEARGIRWGSLIALPGEPHTAGRVQVMEQAAVALAIGRLAQGDADEWTRRGNEQLLTDLLGARYSSIEGMTLRFEAAGLPVQSRALVGLAIQLPPGDRRMGDVSPVAAPLGGEAIIAAHPSGTGVQIVAVSVPLDARLTDAAFDALARRLATAAGSEREAVVAIGRVAHDIGGLLASIEEAGELLRTRRDDRSRGVVVLRGENRPLLRLVTAFAGDPRMQAHTEEMLRPLIEYDLDAGGDLLAVLRAYVSFPGNRTKAASASHLSRSVFYQRIALIEELLGVDLDDGETVSALHAALLARAATR